MAQTKDDPLVAPNCLPVFRMEKKIGALSLFLIQVALVRIANHLFLWMRMSAKIFSVSKNP